MSQFTDHLGNPINVGDIIVYPQSAYIQMAKVLEIDEIVRIQTDYGHKAVLHSQRLKPNATSQHYPQRSVFDPRPGDKNHWEQWKQIDDPEKAFILKVQRYKFDRDLNAAVVETEIDDYTVEPPTRKPVKPSRLTNVDRVTVVTSLVAHVVGGRA